MGIMIMHQLDAVWTLMELVFFRERRQLNSYSDDIHINYKCGVWTLSGTIIYEEDGILVGSPGINLCQLRTEDKQEVG